MENIERKTRLTLLRDILVTEQNQINIHVPFVTVQSFNQESLDKIFSSIQKFSPRVQSNIMIMVSDLKQLLSYYNLANIHSVQFTMGKFTLIKFLFNKEKSIVVHFDYYTYLKFLEQKLKVEKIQVSQILSALLCFFFIIMLFK